MTQNITLDFSNAAPAQPGQGFARIPEGQYPLRVSKLEGTQAASGRPMVRGSLTVTSGEMSGKTIGVQFTLPKDADDSIFGLQQLHQFFVALGMKQQNKAVTLDLEQFVKRELVADVQDDVIPAKGQYSERLVSKPIAFYPKKGAAKSPNGAPAAPAEVAAAPEAPAEEPAPAAVAVTEEVASDEVATDPDNLDTLFDE